MERARLLGALVVASLALAGPASVRAAPPSPATSRVDAVMAQALAAHANGDVRAFRARMLEAYRLAPSRPDVAYDMACAYALTGDGDRAIALLERLADAGLGAEAVGDRDFDSIRNTPGFRAIVRRIAAGQARVQNAVPAFTLAEQDLVPSGIAYDPVERHFYTTSLRHRKIMVTDESGNTREFIAEGQDGFGGGTGIAVDPLRRVLWACSVLTPQVPGAKPDQDGQSSLYEYDLRTGRLRHVLRPPGERPHAFSDVVVADDGSAYVADARAGAIWIARASSKLKPLVREGFFSAPAGLALNADGTRLFVAHRGGIAWLDPRNPVAYKLGPGDADLSGVTALAFDRGALLAVQPALRRIVRLQLDPDLAFVANTRVVEANHSLFAGRLGRGTLGPDGYYVIANTSEAAFDRNGRLTAPGALRAPVVLKVPLAS